MCLKNSKISIANWINGRNFFIEMLLYTRSYRDTEGQTPAIRAATALARTLAEMTIYIDENELIVGNRTSKRLAGVIPVKVPLATFFRSSPSMPMEKSAGPSSSRLVK